MKNKLLLSLFMFSFGALAQTNCTPPKAPKKVLLFVDTNLSAKEIAVAKKAACLRGEEVRIIPKKHIEIDKARDVLNSAITARNSCKTNCKHLDEKISEAEINFRNSKADFNFENELSETLSDLRSKGQKMTNFTISGHNGGGRFGGEKFSVDRYQIESVLSKFSDINEAESVLLLGCYTGVQREMTEWKKLFPHVKLIGGYDGSAPLSDRPQGHTYISDILLKEEKLKNISNEKLLNQQAKALIKSLGGLNSAVYLNPACEPVHEDQDGYLYSSGNGRNFTPMMISQCEKKLEALRPMEETLAKYKSGELEPPTDTQAELRQIYNAYRANHHCITPGLGITDPEVVFNLLFWHGVKESYVNYYEDDLKQVAEALKNFNPESLVKELDDQIKYIDASLNDLHADHEKMKNNPEEYFNKLNKDAQEMEKTFEETQAKFAEVSRRIENGAEIDKEAQDIIFRNSLQKSALEDIYARLERRDINAELAQVENYIKLTEDAKFSFENSKEKVRSVDLSKIKVPTKENIKKFSRNDAMDTMHEINRVLQSMPIGSKTSSALSWLNSSMAQHFSYHDNPFSWHEALPQPEDPPRSIRFGQFQGGGYGIIGGSAGGLGSSMGIGY